MRNISCFCFLDNVCIDSMSVKINRRTMEKCSAKIQILEKAVSE